MPLSLINQAASVPICHKPRIEPTKFAAKNVTKKKKTANWTVQTNLGRMLILNGIKVKSESTIVDIQTDYLQKQIQ